MGIIPPPAEPGLRFLVALIAIAALCPEARPENWPGWRGPRGDGTSLEEKAPVHWTATSNIAWRTEIPGLGHASPIVWEDKLFTITCLSESEQRVLLCLERNTGWILWQKIVLQSPLEKKHPLNSQASSTPATDVKRRWRGQRDQTRGFLRARRAKLAGRKMFCLARDQQWPDLFAGRETFVLRAGKIKAAGNLLNPAA